MAFTKYFQKNILRFLKVCRRHQKWKWKLGILEATGLDFDDLDQISLTIEGLDGISKASQEGRSPKIGSELDFSFSAKVKGELGIEKIFFSSGQNRGRGDMN